jgi:hypothetical protein
MSRPLRIEYPDAWYHVMNRGRRSEKVFSTPMTIEATENRLPCARIKFFCQTVMTITDSGLDIMQVDNEAK